jgi:CheY-like chemotaxis protein
MTGQILVIEDEPVVYKLLEDALASRDFTLTWVKHPSQAQTLHPELKPDLIFMDLALPSLDGIKLAGYLREYRFAHTPIVAFTASRIMLHFAQESGLFQECLLEPLDLSEILECAHRYAGRYVAGALPVAGQTRPRWLAGHRRI